MDASFARLAVKFKDKDLKVSSVSSIENSESVVGDYVNKLSE